MNTEQNFQITFEAFKYKMLNSNDNTEITKSLNNLLLNVSTLRHVTLYKNFCYPIIKNNPSRLSSICSVDKCINGALLRCCPEERVLLLSEKITNIVAVMKTKAINKHAFSREIDVICSALVDYKTCLEIVRLIFDIMDSLNVQQLAFGSSNILITELMNRCMTHLRRAIYSETSLDNLLIIGRLNNFIMFAHKHQQKLIRNFVESRRTELLRVYRENIDKMNQIKEFEKPMNKVVENALDNNPQYSSQSDSQNSSQDSSQSASQSDSQDSSQDSCKDSSQDSSQEPFQQFSDENIFDVAIDWTV